MSTRRPSAAEVAALLPLPPANFQILVALADDELHGYAILQDVASRTGGAVQLGAGTLYRAIHRMLEGGLVAECSERPDPALDDERRRYYR
ncbi:MAG TPA: helix-turn-helix transcriptional regulator, partial [Thermoanaerobaculia bacterium]|nr:helix-turn-helix transcriptional regulator [Thermoanaerobaculia bacterium]